MTKDEILQIAGECGIDAEKDTLCRHGGWVEPIERFAAAMYAKGAEDMRERAANALNLTTGTLLLMAGEMTTQELRTVHAVLNWREKAIRALPTEGEQ